MNADEKNKPVAYDKEMIDALGIIEDSTALDGGDRSITSGYTPEEIEEAQKAATEIMSLSKNLGRAIYDLAAEAVKFRDQKLYLRLGYSTFNSWYFGQDHSIVAILNYMKIYEELHLKHQIDLGDLASIDTSMNRYLLQLINLGATGVQFRTSLETLKNLDLDHAIAWIEKAVKNLKAGRDMFASLQTDSDRPEDLESSWEYGYYLLEPIPAKDFAKVDPSMNVAVKRVRNLNLAFYKNEEDNSLIMEVKP